jgi:hypothetical protein
MCKWNTAKSYKPYAISKYNLVLRFAYSFKLTAYGFACCPFLLAA